MQFELLKNVAHLGRTELETRNKRSFWGRALPLFGMAFITLGGCKGLNNGDYVGNTLFLKNEILYVEKTRYDLKPKLEEIHNAKGLLYKKAAVKGLVDKVNKDVIKDTFIVVDPGRLDAVFLLVAEKFLKHGMFVSQNDKENEEAAIFFYSHFPMKFVDHVFERYKDANFDDEVSNKYRRAIRKIGKGSKPVRDYILKKVTEAISNRGMDEGSIKLKIFASLGASDLEAVELIPSFEKAIKEENNLGMKEIFAITLDALKGLQIPKK